MSTIDVNGEILSYRNSGEGDPVLLLHAVGASGQSWSDIEAELAKKYSVYVFDLRGHGASTLNGRMTLEDMAKDVEELVNLLNIGSCHVIGTSIGAMVAVKFAAAAPNSIKSLSLAGVGLVPDSVLADEIYGIREAVHYLTDEDFAYQVAEALLIPDAPEESVKTLGDGILAQTKQNYLMALEAMEAGDLSASVDKIEAPAIVIHGVLDEFVTLDCAKSLVEAFSNGSLTSLDNAGQVAYLDCPEQFLAEVSGFLHKNS